MPTLSPTIMLQIIVILSGLPFLQGTPTPEPTGESAFRGYVSFLSAGHVASPVVYGHFGLRLTNSLLDEIDEVERLMNETIWDFSVKHYNEYSHDYEPSRILFDKRMDQYAGILTARAARTKYAILELLGHQDSPQRRQALGILSGVLGGLGAIISVGSAIYTDHQVHQVQATLQRVVHRQREELRALKELRDAVKTFHRDKYQHVFEEDVYHRLERIVEDASRQFDGWIEGVYALLQHELHPALVTPTLRQEFLDTIERDVRGSGSEMVVDFRKDLHDIPISWIVTESFGITLILHIPLITDSRTMLRDLYRLDAAVLDNGHEMVRFLSPEPMRSSRGRCKRNTEYLILS